MSAHRSGARSCSVGLDIGGTKVLGVLLGPDGAVLRTLRVPTRPGVPGVVDTAEEVVRRLCADAGVAPRALAGVGAGVPGLVDPATGRLSYAVNLGIHERGVDLAPVLAARLDGVPVVLENDLNAAAVGAARLLGLPGDLALLALGTGVAAGLLLGGELRRGRHGAAGEIGHLPYDPAGPRCPCGQLGCLELYASGAALDLAWPVRSARPAAADLFAAAAAGDRRAVVVRDRFADAVATAVRLLVLTCDVEHVVLGGGVADVGPPLLDAVVAAAGRQAAGSAFLQSLAVPERVQLVPRDLPVAPVGAAVCARGGVPGVVEPVGS
ncbi:ROK family protein [Blastococcus sp. SYSU DS1021]